MLGHTAMPDEPAERTTHDAAVGSDSLARHFLFGDYVYGSVRGVAVVPVVHRATDRLSAQVGHQLCICHITLTLPEAGL